MAHTTLPARRWAALLALALVAGCGSDDDAPGDAGPGLDASAPPDSGATDASAPPDDDAGATSGYASLGLGYRHSCAITTDGTAQCWGSNAIGQAGLPETGSTVSTPADVQELGAVVAIAGGEDHSCAVLEDGSVACWGENSDGQLGRGTTSVGSSVPATIASLTGVTAIALGASHSCALAAGAVHCWGANEFGQLGDGTTTERAAPGAVPGISGAIAIGAGDYHSCAVLAGGAVRCWGLNTDGQLGDGTTTNRPEPVEATDVTGVVELDGGQGFTCARTATSVTCWGAGDAGQLGDGSSGDRPTAAPVPGITGALGIAAGSRHACARLADGTARCWGYGARGQLGDGSDLSGLPVIRRTPVSVMELDDVSVIAAGGSHTCALAGGRAYCWGDDAAGQLGDEASGAQATPVQVEP
ncbi:RCC1 domain-containing protein [Sandaracinus amylolyticus]|uniref:RCC1 domain-containing protein n=1 Tax=Sandaracinus amylolyticus TaxID=927083 RepID=UPI001F1FADE5|nr:hypothetical protein [Sandaracinus amylolyticus]UJR86133.1 Hypothetical protein I5071_82140 [Sandaracinus amylolyticus]